MERKWVSGKNLCEEKNLEPFELFEIITNSVKRTSDLEELANTDFDLMVTYIDPDWRGSEVYEVGLQAYDSNGKPFDQSRYLRLYPKPGDPDGTHYIEDVLFLRKEVDEYFEQRREQTELELSDEFYSKDFPKSLESQQKAVDAYLMKYLHSFNMNEIKDSLGMNESEDPPIYRLIRQGRKVLIKTLCSDKHSVTLLRQEVLNIKK